MNRQWTVKKYLSSFALAVIVNLMLLGGFEIFVQKQFVEDYHLLSDSTFPASRAMSDIDMMHDGIRSVIYMGFYKSSHGQLKTKGQKDELTSEMDEFVDNIFKHFSKIDSLHLPPEIKSAIADAKPLVEAYTVIAKNLTKLLVSDQSAQADRDLVQFNTSFSTLEEKLEKLSEFIDAKVAETGNQTQAHEEFYSRVSYLALLLSMMLALGNAVWIMRSISSRLTHILVGLENESRMMNVASKEVDQSAQTLSNSSTQQSAAIQETASSMEEMTQMVTQTTQNSEDSLNVANRGNEDAGRGRQVLDKLVHSMNEIEDSNHKVEAIVKLIEDIRNRTKVINDIVFETRLLSFNASIEAARAGVHGKGFSVVAEEVGKLANMSGKAADEIRTLLDSSTNEVNDVVRLTKDRVLVGKSVTEDSKQVFGSMGDSMTKINESVRSISSAAKEQETGIRQVTKAINELEKVTLSNSKNADSLADQSRKLNQSSGQLSNLVLNLASMIRTDGHHSSLQTSPQASLQTKRSSASTNHESDFETSNRANIHALSSMDQNQIDSNPSTSSHASGPSRQAGRWKKSA